MSTQIYDKFGKDLFIFKMNLIHLNKIENINKILSFYLEYWNRGYAWNINWIHSCGSWYIAKWEKSIPAIWQQEWMTENSCKTNVNKHRCTSQPILLRWDHTHMMSQSILDSPKNYLWITRNILYLY